MAISYSLAVAAPVDVRQVAHATHQAARSLRLVDAHSNPDAFLDGADLVRGTWVLVAEAKVQPWNPVVADLGFTPTARLAFRLGKDGPLDPQVDDVLALSVGLLDHVAGDAVLHRDFEEILLLRRAGQLLLNERDDLWTAQRLAAVRPRPFRRETHAFSEED
ncbi:SitI3 family protein [Nocardia sp. NRRL S-836]|uniref:SitI3 family protein n=1 Tax=Nocardia sp. NRRL S-836 TaxID=1519492 RepID=UPI0006AEEAB8|nr:SitI3 family protein [Nocardia sp. NRRL S-836]KOV76907.1 hypothetical protein ADL03_42485 [Nocardia sp. NRRL S-836]